MDDILEMLRKKHEILTQALKMTEETVFTDDPAIADQETERYIMLYEGRDGLISQLTDVQEKMTAHPGYQEFKALATGDAAALLSECDTLLRRIIELDKRNENVGKTMFEHVKQNIKRINQGRNMSLKYSSELLTTDGYKLDAKN